MKPIWPPGNGWTECISKTSDGIDVAPDLLLHQINNINLINIPIIVVHSTVPITGLIIPIILEI